MTNLVLIFLCFGVGVTLAKPLEGINVQQEITEVEISGVEIELEIPVAPKNTNIKELLDRFFALIDRKELSKFIFEKLTTDPEAQAVYRYMRGEKAKKIVSHVMQDPEYDLIVRWFYENGVTNIYSTINRIHAFFGWDTISGSNGLTIAVDANFGRSLQTLFQELLEVLPLNAMAAMALDLYQSHDPAAVALINRFREQGMADAWHRLKSLPEAIELGDALAEGGIAVEIMIVIIEAFFGWA